SSFISISSETSDFLLSALNLNEKSLILVSYRIHFLGKLFPKAVQNSFFSWAASSLLNMNDCLLVQALKAGSKHINEMLFDFLFDTAGNDVFKIPQIGIHVQRKSVHRHPFGSFHTQSTYFSGIRPSYIQPNAGFAFAAFAFQAVFCNHPDNDFFQISHVEVDV